MPRDKLLRKIPQRIGDILVQEGWISPETLEVALETQRKSTVKRIGEILRDGGHVSDEQIARALAKQYDLEYFDLQGLPDGWKLHRPLFTFKCKHLKILPMQDPEGHIWLILSDVTEDEKMEISLDDASRRVKFAIASSTAQTQALDENLTDAEIAQLETVPRSEFPPVREGDGPVDPAVRIPQLEGLTRDRLKQIVGVVRGQSATEYARTELLEIRSGAGLGFRFEQIVHEASGDLPEGYVRGTPETVGRNLKVVCTLPPFEAGPPRAEGEPATDPMAWPKPWPPPDLADELEPLLESHRAIPRHLMQSATSLCWMGRHSKTRTALNDLTIQTLGVSLGLTRIHDVDELWNAIRARLRGLEANRVVRGDWERWRDVQRKALDISPGHILSMCCLILLEEPKTLAPRIEISHDSGPVFEITLKRKPGDEPLESARYLLQVTGPPPSDA